MALVADHRPERMQHWQPASHALQAGGAGPAKAPASQVLPHGLPDASLWPTWLLRPPQRLAVQGSRPCYQGPLRLLAGPHRLEAAWWEVADAPESPPNACGADPAPGLVVRDYFVAHNERAGHVWVFRERTPSAPLGTEGGPPTRQHRWFLHGIYG